MDRVTRGAKGAGQGSDTHRAELSLPSACSCRPWEANSMQDFAIYIDIFTRGGVNKLSPAAWEQAAQGPRLFSYHGLFQGFFAAAPKATLSFTQTLRERVFRFGVEFLCRENQRLTNSLFSPRACLVRRVAPPGIDLSSSSLPWPKATP